MNRLTKQELEEKYAEFLKLVSGKEWSLFVEFLDDHKKFLQEKSNQFLRDRNTEQAAISLALMDDCSNWIELFKRRGLSIKKMTEE